MDDESYVEATLARQGIAVPARHLSGLAANARMLGQTAASLESRLQFGDDIHGFQTVLAARRGDLR